MSLPAQSYIPPANSGLTTSFDLEASSLNSLVPSVVRSRLPVLPSLRQSARNIILRPSLQSRTISEECIPSSTPSIQSRRASITSISDTVSVLGSGACSPRLIASNGEERALANMTPIDLPIASQDANVGGVDWMLAGAGVRLWLNARRQAELDTRDPVLLRSMHIDALKYMNMALPVNLSHNEIDMIQASLPVQIRRAVGQPNPMVVASGPNILRKSVAQAVCWTIAVILLVIPLLMTAVNRILLYERQHRIARRVINNGADFTKTLSERGLDIGNALVRFKDTPFGRTWLEVMSWTIESVAGGLNDGIIRSTNGRIGVLEQ